LRRRKFREAGVSDQNIASSPDPAPPWGHDTWTQHQSWRPAGRSVGPTVTGFFRDGSVYCAAIRQHTVCAIMAAGFWLIQYVGNDLRPRADSALRNCCGGMRWCYAGRFLARPPTKGGGPWFHLRRPHQRRAGYRARARAAGPCAALKAGH